MRCILLPNLLTFRASDATIVFMTSVVIMTDYANVLLISYLDNNYLCQPEQMNEP